MGASSETAATAGLIFPFQATTNIDTQLRHIEKAAYSIQNRLRSIESDAKFVECVARDLKLPVIANERCGSWYVRPDLKKSSSYFKSTDGHFGQWSLSLRRLNLQVLDVVGRTNGCIIVDSTRRGKSMPDALSKTVPIWCAVMNRLLFPEAEKSHNIQCLRNVVSDSEVCLIESRLDGFLKEIQALDLDIKGLRLKVKRPLHPVWIARSLELVFPLVLPVAVDSGQHSPVYLCMASICHISVSQMTNYVYIQGAGDDSESWAHGLTPAKFWHHKERLLDTPEFDIPAIIESLASEKLTFESTTQHSLIIPGSWLFIGALSEELLSQTKDAFVITCSSDPGCVCTEYKAAKTLNLECGTGKSGSRDLRLQLTKIPSFVQGRQIEKMFVCCSSGKDISVGVALTLLVLYTDDQGLFTSSAHDDNRFVDKALIRKKLSWIMASVPSASPSRATLNAVNSFLMARPQ